MRPPVTRACRRRCGHEVYAYAFNGQWGSLDHALASPSRARQVTGVAAWHVNAVEPAVLDDNTNSECAGHIESLYAADAFRSPDHDPLIVGLDLGRGIPPTCALAVPSVTHLWPVNHSNGRAYHVSFTSTGTFATAYTGTVQGRVAANQSRFAAPVDDGPLYDATQF